MVGPGALAGAALDVAEIPGAAGALARGCPTVNCRGPCRISLLSGNLYSFVPFWTVLRLKAAANRTIFLVPPGRFFSPVFGPFSFSCIGVPWFAVSAKLQGGTMKIVFGRGRKTVSRCHRSQPRDLGAGHKPWCTGSLPRGFAPRRLTPAGIRSGHRGPAQRCCATVIRSGAAGCAARAQFASQCEPGHPPRPAFAREYSLIIHASVQAAGAQPAAANIEASNQHRSGAH